MASIWYYHAVQLVLLCYPLSIVTRSAMPSQRAARLGRGYPFGIFTPHILRLAKGCIIMYNITCCGLSAFPAILIIFFCLIEITEKAIPLSGKGRHNELQIYYSILREIIQLRLIINRIIREKIQMKKLLLMLVLTSALILSACGSKTTGNNDSDTGKEKSVTKVEGNAEKEEAKDSSKSDDSGKVAVDKGLFDVKLTIPESFVEGQTQDELDKVSKDKGYKSITLNDDGSATYVMTKKQHKKMMDEMTNTINDSIKEMIGSEDYPSFKEIKANDDFTKFTVKTTSTDLDLKESFSTMVFYTYGGMYNVFNGSEADNIAVTFVNADTGKTITTSNSSDMEE